MLTFLNHHLNKCKLLGGWASNDNGGVGSTYVFSPANGVWTQQQKLTASDVSGRGLAFGSDVALSEAYCFQCVWYRISIWL